MPGRRRVRALPSHRHQRGVLAPLEDLVEAHDGTGPPRRTADVDVVGELPDEAQAATALRLRGRRATRAVRPARGGSGKTGARVGDLDPAPLAVQVGRDPVRLAGAVGAVVPAVLDGVRAGLAQRDGEVEGDVRVHARGLHGADQQAAGQGHARSLAPQME
ncbi:putative ATP/GTP-binding protein [Streptomyces coelicolor A3(2)]|uniref:ATP/GTP-binding protein n=1 Tax=Streptomyces coelicolor (strain ATCC BAA-471 / A3(2) / M145) TaxID=100226 RepID=Q93J37_STRCO|nr:putative ATP/GTP-binding protein [Streptomyces coelicolor A3(2)]